PPTHVTPVASATCGSPVQSCPHAPQFFGSVAVSTQAAPHVVFAQAPSGAIPSAPGPPSPGASPLASGAPPSVATSGTEASPAVAAIVKPPSSALHALVSTADNPTAKNANDAATKRPRDIRKHVSCPRLLLKPPPAGELSAFRVSPIVSRSPRPSIV